MNASRFVQQLLNLASPPAMTAHTAEDRYLPEFDQYMTDYKEITGETAKSNGISITHIRPVSSQGFGGATIAYRPDNEFHNCRMVQVAVAYCSPHDTFSKKVGTRLATEKFLNGETILVPMRDPKNPDALPLMLQAMFGFCL